MKNFLIPVFILLVAFVTNDVKKDFYVLDWEISEQNNLQQNPAPFLSFDGAEFIYDGFYIPVFVKNIQLPEKKTELLVSLDDTVFEELSLKNELLLKKNISNEINLNSKILSSDGKQQLQIQFIPLVKRNNKIFLLKSFSLRLTPSRSIVSETKTYPWKTGSVLNNGVWLKIKTSGKGIYKIPYSKLTAAGFTNPAKVSIYGSGGISLPEDPGDIPFDDLNQCAVWHGKNNGTDCLFFYEPGTIKWNISKFNYSYSANNYSNSGYFFLTETGEQKIIKAETVATKPATHLVAFFDDYLLHEKDTINLISSGKQWFGEKFGKGTQRNFQFNLKNPDIQSNINFTINTASRSLQSSEMAVSVNQLSVGKIDFQSVSTDDQTSLYASEKMKSFSSKINGSEVVLTLKYNPDYDNSEAWLDYLIINYKRKLKVEADPIFFRDIHSVGNENYVEFQIENCNSETKVFDVSDLNNLKEIKITLSGNTGKFIGSASELREYVAFNTNGNFTEPQFSGSVENQNLHGLKTPEYLIISNPKFLSAANKLAEFHRNKSNLEVEVVSVNQVYNEFSSGNKDATGIRNFIKMFYDRGSKLKYILLFGDGSFDNKNIFSASNAYIPTFQSDNSLDPVSSFVTDDYFVMLDAGESVYNGAVDLGIGRIPASTLYEADLVLGKILRYFEPKALGTWRNTVCFIGDDGDGNLHMSDSETLANIVNDNHREFITDKIYFDAFKKDVTTGGGKYPDVTSSINNKVQDGVLILNYVGHANDRFMADEKVLDISTIKSWSNENTLPIFVTATCEFSRFDANETSAGEHILFNPSGGGIGLFSTTRVVFAYSNFLLSKNFYRHVFQKDANGKHYRMGEIMRLAKINTINTTNQRNFTLLADPALILSYPEYKVNTATINQKPANEITDTIGAMQKITVSGYITDFNGNKITNFNGTITPTVYDKQLMMNTLGNEGNTPMNFKVQENIIYKGLAKVTNGNFSFCFVVPKDITYNIGKGKIAYYAENGITDANGAFENFFIGGSAKNQLSDNTGPNIKLHMDSPDFISGGQTSKNPILIAFLSDDNGINTVGAGIGHDITGVLDNDNSNVLVLNKYYRSEIDDYKKGTIIFQLKDLKDGEHTLKVKAWDIANNSTEQEIKFVVSGDFKIMNVTNFPNPVNGYTFFTFEHNHTGASLDALIEIFDMTGKRVDYFNTSIGSNGLKSNPVRWDLNSVNQKLKNGIYLYRISAKTKDGIIASKSGKLSIVR